MMKLFASVATIAVLLVLTVVLYAHTVWAEDAASPATAGGAGAEAAAESVRPDPMRYICAVQWNQYYKKKGIEITVSTRGKYNEVLVISCPMCSVKDYVVEPFLFTRHGGKTGMEKIKECGFTKVAFRGSLGMREIVYDVPR